MKTTAPVLITGSAGYIGTRLCTALSAEYRIVGLDRSKPENVPPGTAFVECDLTDDRSITRAVDSIGKTHGTRITSCVHLAAYYDFSGEPSPLYRTLTVEGTRRLLRALQPFDLEQFVFSSTHIVMEPAEEDEVITESSPTKPAWDYPRSKLEAEKVIRVEHGDVPVVVLRLAGVYDEETRVVPVAQQMRRIYEKQFQSYFFPGDASHGQAFVHLEDVVDCVRRTIEARSRLGPYEVFLIAEPDVMSYRELQDRLGELIHGAEWPTIRIPKAVAKAGAWVEEKMAGEEEEAFIKPWMIDLADDHYPIAIRHAQELLGWKATRRLRTTLPEMVAALKRDPVAWYRTNKLGAPEPEQT